MKMLGRLAFAAALIASPVVLAAPCLAASTVDPNVPAPGAALASAPIRDNFLATATDINNILGMYAGTSPPTSPSVGQDWLNIGTNPYTWNKWTGAGGWGQVGTINPSTGAVAFALSSGSIIASDPITASFTLGAATIGLAFDSNFAVVSHQLALAPIASGSLIANCTASMAEPTAQTMTACLDRTLGTTSGLFAKRGASNWSGFNLFGSSNIFTVLQIINQNAVAPPTAITGAGFQVVGADGAVGRVEVDSFGAIGAVTVRRANGTGASPTALTTSDQIGAFNFHGFYVTGGPSYSGVAASVGGFASQPWTSTATGTYVEIRTTPNGTVTLTGVARFENDGGVTIPSTVTGGSKGPGTLNAGSLYVNGVAVTGGGITALTGDATASGPGSAAITVLHAPASGITGATLAANVLNTSITGVGALASGSLATGFTPITNALLANSATTVNGQSCALGGTCTISAAASLVVGSTTITSGVAGRVLMDVGGTTLGEYSTSGTGNVAMTNSPAFTTPNIGVATATSVNKVAFTAPATGATLTILDGKTFTANKSITLDGTDSTTWTGPGSSFNVAALNLTNQSLTGGATVTPAALGTMSSFTLNCGLSSLQFGTNNGAFTLTAPANDSSCILRVTNGASAGAITFTGWTVGSNTGDTYTTTNAKIFDLFVRRINGASSYMWSAIN